MCHVELVPCWLCHVHSRDPVTLYTDTFLVSMPLYVIGDDFPFLQYLIKIYDSRLS